MKMDRDNNLTKIIQNDGIIQAPEGFTESVMREIDTSSVYRPYKPILSRRAILIFAVFFLVLMVAGFQGTESLNNDPLFVLPDWEIVLPRISSYLLAGVAAGFIPVILLALLESGFKRRIPGI
ncbi:MAG: hypothetical protein WD052_09725 [Bacteroidales bacterium]